MIQDSLISCSDSQFFQLLERSGNLKIPMQLQNILKLNCYNSAVVLTRLNETSIIEMENFMRHVFKESMMTAQQSKSDYLGIFAEDQKSFMFLSGQKTLLTMMAEHCSTLCKPNDTPQPNTLSLHPITIHQGGSSTQDRDDRARLFNIIGSYMITVFNDAKRITLSAWSWPSREVAVQKANNFKSHGSHITNYDFQYLTPSNHTEFLKCIVKSDLENFQLCISESLAISLRLDGSVDGTQKHNVYVMAHIIKKNGFMVTFFIGFAIPKSGNADDYVQCLKDVTTKIFNWGEFFKIVTSIVTDGENLNSGQFNGLWVKLQNERRLSGSNLPLFSIWCVAHRMNLAFKSVCKVDAIATLIRDATHLSTFFHSSGERTGGLNSVAASKNLALPLRFPKYFAVRWVEFIFNLFNVILRNWRAMMEYFEARGLTSLSNRWLVYDRIHALAFVTDVLNILKTYQKMCQSDSISILDVIRIEKNLINRLESCENTPAESGWEERFLQESVININSHSLHGRVLTSNPSRLRHANFKFTTVTRKHIIRKLIGHLKLRFGADDALRNAVKPFVKICSAVTQNELNICHSFIIPDLDVNKFVSEYYTVAEILINSECEDASATLKKLIEIDQNRFQTVKYALARILAAKPHSADVERLINVYNKFKDRDRTSISAETLSNYLYVNTNMVCVENFDPTSAVNYWMAQRNRRPKLSDQSRRQEWFNGVFEDANTTKHREHHYKVEF